MDGQDLSAVVEAGKLTCVFTLLVPYTLDSNEPLQIRGQGSTPNLEYLPRQQSLISAQLSVRQPSR